MCFSLTKIFQIENLWSESTLNILLHQLWVRTAKRIVINTVNKEINKEKRIKRKEKRKKKKERKRERERRREKKREKKKKREEEKKRREKKE